MSVLEETKFLMKKYKIKANKNLGQNFLIDDLAINDIVDGANILENDLVIEIGPVLYFLLLLTFNFLLIYYPLFQMQNKIYMVLIYIFPLLHLYFHHNKEQV